MLQIETKTADLPTFAEMEQRGDGFAMDLCQSEIQVDNRQICSLLSLLKRLRGLQYSVLILETVLLVFIRRKIKSCSGMCLRPLLGKEAEKRQGLRGMPKCNCPVC